MSIKLYVGNISFNTSPADLEQMFRKVGTVQSADVVANPRTGRSRGYGFVEMPSSAEAENAIAQLDGREIDGRRWNVNQAN